MFGGNSGGLLVDEEDLRTLRFKSHMGTKSVRPMILPLADVVEATAHAL